MRKTIILLTFIFSLSAYGQSLFEKKTPKTFTVVKENPITKVKDQNRSGTCWCYATLGYIESEILRISGKTYDLCEMFVVNHDYMDCATHHVRMHGLSDFTEGGSADDVFDVIRHHGICPEEAMAAPGSLVGDTLANFTEFMKVLTPLVKEIASTKEKHPAQNRHIVMMLSGINMLHTLLAIQVIIGCFVPLLYIIIVKVS